MGASSCCNLTCVSLSSLSFCPLHLLLDPVSFLPWAGTLTRPGGGHSDNRPPETVTMSDAHSTPAPAPGKPVKPSPDFPLFAHAAGPLGCEAGAVANLPATTPKALFS